MEVVLKMQSLDQTDEYDVAIERSILNELRMGSLTTLPDYFVPKLISVPGDNEILVTQPVATTLWADRQKNSVFLTGRHLAGVVSTLKLAHSKGIVHRDINPTNLYLISTGPTAYIMTNDWGSSLYEHQVGWVERVGTIPYHNNLEEWGGFAGECRNDLVSLVRTAYVVLEGFASEVDDNVDWDMLLVGHWVDALVLARACKYVGLVEHLQGIQK